MRAFLVVLAAGFASAASAADIPPALSIAKFDDGKLVLEVVKQIPVQKEVVVTVKRGEELVAEKRVVTVIETATMMQQVALKGARITSGGKALGQKELAERLAESAPVVTSMGPIADKYKKLFKDDAILIEFPVPPMVAPPAPKVLPVPKDG